MQDWKLWLARLCILVVLAWNVECAVTFILQPERYAPGFELSGAPGVAMVRGMGILFLMWNVPYAVALTHPLKRHISLLEAVVMQAIGLAGETLVRLTFPGGHPLAVASVNRFIAFDAAGLVLLIIALWLTRKRLTSLLQFDS
jgi:hypothetical protein